MLFRSPVPLNTVLKFQNLLTPYLFSLPYICLIYVLYQKTSLFISSRNLQNCTLTCISYKCCIACQITSCYLWLSWCPCCLSSCHLLVRNTHIQSVCRNIDLDDISFFNKCNWTANSCLWAYMSDACSS